MAITITDIQRPTNCGHFTIIVDDNGVTRSAKFHVDDLSDLPINPTALLCALWVRERRRAGDSWASLIGKVVA